MPLLEITLKSIFVIHSVVVQAIVVQECLCTRLVHGIVTRSTDVLPLGRFVLCLWRLFGGWSKGAFAVEERRVLVTYKIEEIEGIGPVYAEKLGAAGITTTDQLLEACADPKGRADMAGKCDIEQKRILRWANMADLMRISGVGEEYSDLLEAAGVDTVKELRTRVAANLHAKMVEVNEAKKLVRQVPAETQVTKWVEQARDLDPKLTY